MLFQPSVGCPVKQKEKCRIPEEGNKGFLIRKNLFLPDFFRFHRFFFSVFRITIYVTNNKGLNESLIIGEQPDIEGNQKISEKKRGRGRA